MTMKKTLQRLNELELVVFILAAATIAAILMVGNAIWRSMAGTSPQNYQPDIPRKTSGLIHRSPCPAAEADAVTV